MLHEVYSIAINILMTQPSKLAAAALKEITERPQHFQLVTGGMRAVRELEHLGLAELRADLYVYPVLEADRLVTVQAASPEPAGEPIPPTELQWIPTVKRTERCGLPVSSKSGRPCMLGRLHHGECY
jgi:hypothetical protein